MVRSKIRQKLENFLVEELEANVSGLCRNIESLRVKDWLDLYQLYSLCAWMEEEFGIVLKDEEIIYVETFKDIVDIIYQKQHH